MLCNTDKSGMKGLAACTESSQNNTEDCTAVAGLAENVDQLDVVIFWISTWWNQEIQYNYRNSSNIGRGLCILQPHQTQAFILGRVFITDRPLFLDVVDMVFACSLVHLYSLFNVFLQEIDPNRLVCIDDMQSDAYLAKVMKPDLCLYFMQQIILLLIRWPATIFQS